MARLALLGNPTAGSGHGAVLTDQACVELIRRGHDVDRLVAPDVTTAAAFAGEAVAGDVDALVVVGGDGTMHLGVNACAGTPVPLGVVADGSGNDFADQFGLPQHCAATAVARLDAALTHGPRQVDLGRIDHAHGTTYFGAVLAAGFDAVVNERANGWRRPAGSTKYVLAVLRELPVFAPIPYRLVVDGVPEAVDGVLVAVGNCRSYGGGLCVTPDADPTDGLLDLLVAGRVSRRELVRLLPSIRHGGHLRHPAVTSRRVRSVQIEAPGIVGYADGERVAATPLEVSVVPGALRLLA